MASRIFGVVDKRFWALFLFAAYFLGGCAALKGASPIATQNLPTPTYYSFYDATGGPDQLPAPGQKPLGTPTIAQFFIQPGTSTPTVFSTHTPTIVMPTATTTPNQMESLPIYGDQLISGWSFQVDPGMVLNQADSTHAHNGNTSIAITPQQDFKRLGFVVNQYSATEYQRNQVLAISFWLNSGNGTVGLSDIIVGLMGSDTTPYWVANDNSVLIDTQIPFSETRLYYLGVNRSIAPETWVQVIVTLDKLTHDPDYKYVTGFYIKNDAGFHQTVYIDDVEVQMIRDAALPGQTGTATPVPSIPPATGTPALSIQPQPTATGKIPVTPISTVPNNK